MEKYEINSDGSTSRIIEVGGMTLRLTARGCTLTGLEFVSASATGAESSDSADAALLDETERRLREYFAGKRKTFDLPIAPEGTSFRRAVWDALTRIPYGETATYGDIAREIGSPRSARAVGGACHANPIAIIVPCHRVVGADGALTGFGGGLDVKALLLALERANK